MIVVTISGKAEAGKDLTATILKEKLEKTGYRVLIIHYADYLKFIASKYYGWNGCKDEKGRELLQQLGTNVIRMREPNFWANVVIMFLKVVQPDYDYVLIPDCRFINEVELIKKEFNANAIAIRVVRLNYENSLTPEQRKHLSETALDNYKMDYTITSESGKENLEKEVDVFMTEWIYPF